MRELTVVIVNWNTKDLLGNCLGSVFEQAGDLDLEVCVVDNGSADGSGEMVRQEFPQVRLIENEDNLGFAKGNNLVLENCSSRYAMLLNSDTLVLDDALGEMVGFMDEHPEAGVAGCRVLNEDGSLQISCGRFPRLCSIFFGGAIFNNLVRKLFKSRRFFAEYGLSDADHDRVQDVDFVKGCALMIRVSVLEQTGLLDEKMFMFFEEIDLCYRFKQLGHKVLYSPTPRIIHLDGQSGTVLRDTVFRSLKSQEYFFRKHYGKGQAVAMRLVVIAGSLLKLPLFLLYYPFAARDARPGIRSKLAWLVYALKWSVSAGTCKEGA